MSLSNQRTKFVPHDHGIFSEYYDLGNLNPGCFTRGHGIRLRIPRLSGKFDFFKCKVIKSCVLKLKVN